MCGHATRGPAGLVHSRVGVCRPPEAVAGWRSALVRREVLFDRVEVEDLHRGLRRSRRAVDKCCQLRSLSMTSHHPGRHACPAG